MAAVIFTGHSESILQGLLALLALKYVEIHLKHSNRTYKKVTSFLVMVFPKFHGSNDGSVY